jgi:alpha-beta hydrolase superfamily lysophospholipase
LQARRIFKLAIRALIGLVVVVVVAVLGWAFNSRTMPDLHVWHTAELPSAFTRRDIEAMAGLADYLAREDQLFEELQTLVYDRVEEADRLTFNRYNRGSRTDPTSFTQDFNRTYELAPEGDVVCGALLVHGLTDAPYSMRHLAEKYVSEGCYALVMRMPGHGTSPQGLKHIEWRDWRAAVALGARAVRDRIGDTAPLFLAGYSNGGGLVLGHALDALDDEDLVRADGLMLFSPMIGVTPLSRLAGLGTVLTHLDFFEKFAWLSVLPEYDPYKYNSFPKNAGYQTFLVTAALRDRLLELEASDRLSEIPPVLTFQSLVDATVSTPAVVNELYARLRTPGSELVLFDLNRSSSLGPFLRVDHRQFVEDLLLGEKQPYDITLIGNLDKSSRAVGARHRRAQQDEIEKVNLNLSWPMALYSLAHVAIVFPPEDEFYGTAEASAAAGVFNLGSLNPRGERGVTSVPVADLVRLRHNPFFEYMAERVETDIAGYLPPLSGR